MPDGAHAFWAEGGTQIGRISHKHGFFERDFEQFSLSLSIVY
jgi:hypothetical protein